MDAKLFRLPTAPDYYSANTVTAYKNRGTPQVPSPDSRFPGWAAPMSDGRLVTDYSAHCETSIPAGHQFPTKRWMQNNTPQIIEMSRQLAARRTGAVYAFDANVVPPPNLKAYCKPDSCKMVVTGAPGGIGLEREGADAPELFGTYSPLEGFPAPAAQTPLTSRYEGGRNSLRGRVGPVFG